MTKILFDMPDKGYSLDELMLAIEEGIELPDNATNVEVFEAVFGYEPETDKIICNKGMLCYESPQCNYCSYKPDNKHTEQEWWNAKYKKNRSWRKKEK